MKDTHVILRTDRERKERWRTTARAMGENLSQFLVHAADARCGGAPIVVDASANALRVRALRVLRS